MFVHGTDYDTRDGSCLRDYIHVCDIAHAHTLAIEYLIQQKNKTRCDIFNLGTGNGVTVLEAINMFEQVSGVQLNYEKGPRRAGDVVAIYANNELAVNELGWNIQYNLEAMMTTAWNWELKLKKEADLIKQQSLLN
jgi:UDP-glucose 4-epimerase